MLFSLLFFFNDTATTEIYTLSLHDALPISKRTGVMHSWQHGCELVGASRFERPTTRTPSEYATGLRHAPTCLVFLCRSEEHTSELQSHVNLVCRLLLEKKKKKTSTTRTTYV